MKKADFINNEKRQRKIIKEYLNGEQLSGYVCSDCGANNVKLYRYAGTSYVALLCARCAAAEEGQDISKMRPDGLLRGEYSLDYNIENYIPAIPTKDSTEIKLFYYSGGSASISASNWWLALKTLAPDEIQERFIKKLVDDFCNDIKYGCPKTVTEIDRSEIKQKLQKRGKIVLKPIAEKIKIIFPINQKIDYDLFLACICLITDIIKENNLPKTPYNQFQKLRNQRVERWIEYCELHG